MSKRVRLTGPVLFFGARSQRTSTTATPPSRCAEDGGITAGVAAQNVKIWSGRFSAGLGAASCCFGLMIGGGGSTAIRAAADVIGTGCAGRGSTACLGADTDIPFDRPIDGELGRPAGAIGAGIDGLGAAGTGTAAGIAG
jgi:hypothetical protein